MTTSSLSDAQSLVACDPGQLQTLCVPIQRNQGMLEYGSFIDADGNRALIATQVEGVLATTVDSDFPEPPDSLSGRIAIYTSGRFLWSAVRAANPCFVFNPVSINTVQSRLPFSCDRTKTDSSPAIATFRLAALAKWTTKGVANAPHQSLSPGIEVHNVTTKERAKITSGKIGPTNSIAIGCAKASDSKSLFPQQ
jgi:hypothetical protein